MGRTSWPIRLLGFAMLVLVIYGVLITSRATWTLAHGGNKEFEGAFNYPRWSVVHFAGAFLFILILPFQLSARLRNAWRRAHRMAGWVAAAAGLAVSITGVVLPLVMPARPLGERTFMVTVGVLLPLVLWRGLAAARRREFATHRRWMLRVTAMGLGPLTQRVILAVFIATAGVDSMVRFWDLFNATLWLSLVVNLVVAQWWIERTERPSENGSLVYRVAV